MQEKVTTYELDGTVNISYIEVPDPVEEEPGIYERAEEARRAAYDGSDGGRD